MTASAEPKKPDDEDTHSSRSIARDSAGRNAIDGARNVKPTSIALDPWTREYCKTLGKGQLSAGCRIAVRMAAQCLRHQPHALFTSLPGAHSVRDARHLLTPELIAEGMRVAPSSVSKADIEAIFLAMMMHQASQPEGALG